MILNLGCGARTSPHCLNIDRSVHMKIARNPAALFLARRLFGPERLKHLDALRVNALRHDVTRGLPFPDVSADAVYHSYLLQHLDRDLKNPEADPALRLLKECRRVLKSGGVLRVAVPDFEAHCRRYVAHLDRCRTEPELGPKTDEVLAHLLQELVRKEASGSSRQPQPLRAIETFLLGDARARGETHQWDYDENNLSSLLRRAGFKDVQRRDYRTSAIPGWNKIGLDLGEDGGEYKSPTLYLEAVK